MSSGKPKNIPPQKGKNQSNISGQVTLTQWNYPVPPPNAFELYPEDVRERILEEWKIESGHRRVLELEASSRKDRELGLQEYDVRKSHGYDMVALCLSFFLVIVLGAVVTFLLVSGQPAEAIGAALAGLGAFWLTKYKAKK